MEISPTEVAPQTIAMEFNPTHKVDYNPPPAEEGITPSPEAIATESVSSLADPLGGNLDIFA